MILRGTDTNGFLEYAAEICAVLISAFSGNLRYTVFLCNKQITGELNAKRGLIFNGGFVKNAVEEPPEICL